MQTDDHGIRHEYVDCICDSDEHVMRITYFVDAWDNIDEDEVYISVQLYGRTFWERLVRGIKYIFGYQCRYGHWDVTTIRIDQAERIRDLLNRYIESGMNSYNTSRTVKIVEQGENYVITDKGVKVWLLNKAPNYDR